MLLKVAPGAKRIAVLRDANTDPYQLIAITAAVHAASVEIEVLEFGDASGMEGVLSSTPALKANRRRSCCRSLR